MEDRGDFLGIGTDVALGFQGADVDGEDAREFVQMSDKCFSKVCGLSEQELASGAIGVIGAGVRLGNGDHPRSGHVCPPNYERFPKTTQSSSGRIVSVNRPRKFLACCSRTVRFASPWRKKFVTVPGIEACSKICASAASSVPGTTVPRGIQGETRTAGTRIPRRSKLNGAPVPVSEALAEYPSGVQAGGTT